jgi:protein-tyrosine phosphatase
VRLWMVCHGNICRSPMAAAVAGELLARAGLQGEVQVASAGTSAEHQGEGMDRRAAAALARRGWPVPEHRARRLDPRAVEPGDRVLAADRANLAALERLGLVVEPELLRRFDPEAGPGDDEIPDPWFDGPAAFDEALALIERSCAGLVEALAVPR